MKKILLDRNENNYGPSPKCIDVVRNISPELFNIYSSAYRKGYKSILSKRIADDFGVDEERVLLGYGAEDLLKQVVQTYLSKKKRKLLIPSHSWWYYKEIANEVKGKTVEYPIVEGEESFEYDIKRLMDIYNEEEPHVVFIASPNNPTGNSISDEQLTYLLDNMEEAVVVLDEAYWLNSNNKRAMELVEKYSNLIIIRTFSKLYALAGIRIGYAIVGKRLRRIKKLSNRYLGYNRISELIAIAAMDSPEYYDDIAMKMAEDRELYFTELNKINNLKVFKSDANFVLVKVPKESMNPLKDYLLERGLVIKFMNEAVVNSHLRISLGTQEQNRRVIEAIKEFYNDYNK